MREFWKRNSNIIIITFFLFLLFIIIDSIVGKSIIGNTKWNYYELQTRAWLNGKVDLFYTYPDSEIVIYHGKYFVSFPPLPSVLLIPLVIMFPYNVPANFLSFLIFTMEFIIIYKMIIQYKNKEFVSILLALGFTVGTNLMSLSIDSGVWFIAQLLNNFLCILAVKAFFKRKKTLVYFLLALAVGCRPFSAIYMVMFFVYYLIAEKDKKILGRILNNIKPLWPALIIAVVYMAYNYIRFDNILEFGHNYLPEFIEAEHGQFSIHYLFGNLYRLFFNMISIDQNLKITYEQPFCFFIANPVIIMYIYRTIKNYLNTRKIDTLRLMVLISITIHIITICLHRTLGAWQFGARYTCDILPFVFLAFIYKKGGNGIIKLDKFEIVCIIFGVMLNIFGAISMFNV